MEAGVLGRIVNRLPLRGGGGPPGPAPALAAVEDNPWLIPGLLEHPDGDLRHRRLAAAILAEHGGGTVLNVGDPFCQFRSLLPGFQITATDLEPAMVPVPAGTRFVQADFTDTAEFPPGSYDLVVSTDVLEHIPRPRRREFLARSAAIAGRASYLAFPAGRDAAEAEALIRRSRGRTNFREALDEHAEHGLPDPEEVSAELRALGLDHEVRPLMTVAEWLTSFVICGTDWEDPDLVRAYWRFLNRTAPASPGPGPYYRYLAVIRK